MAIGSSIAALRLNEQRKRAQSAEIEATEQLRASLIARAGAAQLTGQAGQRFESLAALRRATAIRPSDELRDLYANAFTLADLRILRTFRGRASQSDPLAFDADLERYATEGERGCVVIRRVSDQQELQRLVPPLKSGEKLSSVICLTPFTEDGRWLGARHEDGIVRIWDLSANRLAFELHDRPTAGLRPYLAHDCAFSSNGAEVAIGLPTGGCTMHETATGRELRRIASSVVPACIVYDPSGTRVALLGNAENTIHLFDLETGREALVIHAPAWLSHLAWSPDGAYIAGASKDASIHVWDAHTGARKYFLKGHSSTPSLIAWSHSGRLIASTSRDNTVRLWDALSGAALVSLPAHCSEPGLRFSRDDRRLSLSAFGTSIGVLEIAFEEIFQSIPPLVESDTGSDFNRMTTLLQGRVLVVASSEGLRFHDLQDKHDLAFMFLEPGVAKSVVASPNGDGFYLCSAESGVSQWMLRNTGGGLFELQRTALIDDAKSFQVTGLSADGRVLALVSEEKGIARLLQLDGAGRRTGKPFEITGQDGLWQAVPSPDGRVVATSYFSNHRPDRENEKIWESATGKLMLEIATGPGGSVSFSADGRWLHAGGVTGYELWHARDWRPALKLSECLNVDFAQSGLFFAGVSDPNVSLMRVKDGTTFLHLKCPENPALRLCRHDTSLVMTAPDTNTYVWDLQALRQEFKAAGLDQDFPDQAASVIPATELARIRLAVPEK